MTLGDWLRRRTPTPPVELSARIQEALGDRWNADAADAPDLCVSAAEALLRELTSRPSVGREAALDLLTVDALATYAFEAASEHPESLADRTARAMTRLAATAAP